MMSLGKLYEKKYVRILFLLCWSVYCISYFGRLNYSSAMPVMIAEGRLTSSEAGFISMLYFAAYGLGQMTNGFLGDRVNPKNMIFSGLLCSGFSNIVMSIAGTCVQMAAVWAFNGYFQAMIWAPIIRTFAEMLDEKNKVNCSVNIVTSQIIGTLLSYILSAMVLAVLPWQGVYAVAAVFLLGMAFIWKLGFAYICRHARVQESGKLPCGRTENEKEPILRLLVSSGILILLVPVIVHGMLKDGVTAWVPTYISESFGIGASFSILLTSVLPIVNLSGAYAARFVFDKSGARISVSVGIFFLTATSALLLLGTAGQRSAVLSVLLLGIITASMMAVNTLMVNLYPLRFQKYGRVSGVSGFLNAMAYLGTAVSTYSIGVLVSGCGWKVTIFTWFGVTAFAGLFCLAAMKTEKRKGVVG